MPRVGERWGAYTLVRPLGHGSFADVWEVRHVALGSRHALKLLDPRWAEHPRVRARFLAEGRILAQLRHPNLVAVTDLVDDGPGRLGLVMDLVDGASLGQRLASDGPFAPAAALAIARGIADGLHRAHEAGVVHRDLKPDNVLLVDEGGALRPVVVDFGVAKILDAAEVEIDGTLATRATTRLGTPQYMAPEQVEASHAVDRRADVFALGAVLYELLVGRPAFEGATSTEVLYRVQRGERRALEGVDPALVAVVDRALAVRPDDRFPTMRDLADAIAGLGFVGGAPAAAPPAALSRPPAVQPTQPTLAPGASAARGLRTLAVLLGAVGIAAVAWVFLAPAASHPDPSTAPPTNDAPERPIAETPAVPPPRPPTPTAPSPTPTAGPEPTPAAPAKPPPVAPRGPSPAQRDAAALEAAWDRVAPSLARCAPPGSPRQTWKVALQVAASGRPTSVRASATRRSAETEACLEATARGVDAGPLSAPLSRVFSLPLP